MTFTDAEQASMTMPAWERAKDAIADGRLDDAVALIDEGAQRVRGLQIYSIEWITSKSCVARFALFRCRWPTRCHRGRGEMDAIFTSAS